MNKNEIESFKFQLIQQIHTIMYLIIANTFWIQKAFMLKQTKATINNYGIYYIKGIGVQQNIEKAKRNIQYWYGERI